MKYPLQYHVLLLHFASCTAQYFGGGWSSFLQALAPRFIYPFRTQIISTVTMTLSRNEQHNVSGNVPAESAAPPNWWDSGFGRNLMGSLFNSVQLGTKNVLANVVPNVAVPDYPTPFDPIVPVNAPNPRLVYSGK